MKRVTVSIKMDTTFVQLLNTSVQLGRLQDRDELTPIAQLALLVIGEARGGLPEQIHASILPTWRPHIEAVHEARHVEEVT